MVIVTGGIQTVRAWTGRSGALKSVELLYTNGTHRCFLPDLPQVKTFPTQVGLLTCSGKEAKKSCWTLSGGKWKKSHTLTGSAGYGQVGWASPQGVLLMGGTSGSTTTELLMENGHTKPGFGLKHKAQ